MVQPNEKHPAIKIAKLLSEIIKSSGKTGIDSQIEFMELLNSKMMQTPTFIAIIQSLKELRAIKKERIPCKHDWVSSVAYKGARICTKCDKIE